jgi:hypothetical protein
MATMPSKLFAPAFAVGLGLTGAALVGPAPLGESAGHASASALVGVLAFEESAPPPSPDPAPDTAGPPNPGQQPPAPPPHRRHIDGDPIIER